MNILVTGATGFIGGAIVKRLLSTKSKIFVFVRNKQKINNSKKIVNLIGDLRDYKSVEKAFKNIDFVINSAGALPHHKLSDKEYWDINSTGVENIVKACLKNKIKRLIHISTVGIFEKQQNPYTLSKLSGEKIIRASKLTKSSIILRPTICYGPSDVRPVFLRLFKMIKQGINISIGKGENYFHTIYIDNLVNAVLESISLRSVLGKDFIIGDLNCPKMKDITKEIGNKFNNRYINFNISKNLAILVGKILNMERTISFISENRRYNIDKYKKYFGLKKDIGISSGLEKTYNWYKQDDIL